MTVRFPEWTNVASRIRILWTPKFTAYFTRLMGAKRFEGNAVHEGMDSLKEIEMNNHNSLPFSPDEWSQTAGWIRGRTARITTLIPSTCTHISRWLLFFIFYFFSLLLFPSRHGRTSATIQGAHPTFPDSFSPLTSFQQPRHPIHYRRLMRLGPLKGRKQV